VFAIGRDAVRHGALFFRTAQELISGIEAFAGQGLAEGQAVLIASAGTALAELRSRLGRTNPQVSWIDLTGGEGRPGRFTSALLAFADHHRGQGIRCVQEPGWHARPALELNEALRHEALINLALASSSASVLCAFPAELAAIARKGAERTHPALVRDGQWQPSSHFEPGNPAWPEPGEPLTPVPAAAARLSYRDDLRAVRQFVAAQARQLGLPRARVTDIVVAASELAANTLVHTSGPGQLTIWAEPGEIVCQVEDRGHIADPLAGMTPPAPASAGRQGLWVVHQVTDLTEIRTSPAGTTVRFRVRLDP
jgi:anti-sigma regulatory factor (Ser/Thr protein kinase)